MAPVLLTIGLMALSAAVAAMATLRVIRRGSASSGGFRDTVSDDTHGKGGSVALFDPDDMKAINVSHGFDSGDRLLNAIGDTLRRGLPPGSAIERLENGRFLACLPNVELPAATDLIERMRNLAAKTLVQGRDAQIACEMTAAVVAVLPDEARSRTILRADALLAQAKSRGGARTEAASSVPIATLAPSRDDVEAAIARRELEYHVQPIVDLTTGTPVGVEALLRWNRPDGSVVGPAGFIDALTRIPEAGSDLLAHLAVETTLPFVHGPDPIYVTFNITGPVLDGKGSPGCSWLTHVIDNVPNEHLVLELVETAVIVNTERALDLTQRTRAKGIRIALDDFGTGLSNIERLSELPVDILKVDRALVQDIDTNERARIILQGIVSLAQSLGVELIAEGVETEDQAQCLRDLGVRFAQGFHFGRPAAVRVWAERMGRTS